MKLSEMPKTVARGSKRLGRGYGSGKGGHTSSRGQKGQKTRSKLPLYFEGSKMRKTYIRRMPMLRGKMKFKGLKPKPFILNLKDLVDWKTAETVTVENLIKAGYLPKSAKTHGVKLLGEGKLASVLKIEIPTSKSVAKKIKSK
jgi:large subunit ribosomal protein L15